MRHRMRTVLALACVAVVATAFASTSAANAADGLLSRDKPVTASSSAGCCAAKNAVDGNSGTRWASVSNKDPQWIYVDLGSAVHIQGGLDAWKKANGPLVH